MVSQTRGEPTEAQKREFWKWCGFKYRKLDYVSSLSSELNGVAIGWLSPEAISEPYSSIHFSEELPPIDLNNLFKYAVPKVDTVELVYDYRQSRKETGYKLTHSDYIFIATVTLDVWGNIHATVEDKDPALALFWALWQVKEEP